MNGQPEVLTIGHSTHDAERFQALLRTHRIELLADVRRHPGSRRHPQFGADSLSAALRQAGIGYRPLGEQLGGRRRPLRDSRNTGWRVAAFRAYADHMRSPEFAAGLEVLEEQAQKHRVAIMCAEGDWRRCHRRLIADALLAGGWRVRHIRPDGGLEDHELTPFAIVQEGRVGYPAQGSLDA
ncbi:MAG TPA: DUF488 domain-containing protein [Solirubrobacterales bacterium]|nr:DUF488 domain-containing protein [Solirubrobacterales bacterium]